MLSIANISKELNIPESTLHYWKNRFAEYLPSIGRGRQRRYRTETIEIFRTISELLKLGHTTRDVKTQLADMYPLNIDPARSANPPSQTMPAMAQPQEMQLQTAVAVGTEIAKVLGEKLGQALNALSSGMAPETMERMQQGMRMLEDQARDMESLRGENIRLHNEMQHMRAELETLRDQQKQWTQAVSIPDGHGASAREDNGLKDKLEILEAELVRLRKDRRDMEKFLLEKISASKTP